jgi:NTE family protein
LASLVYSGAAQDAGVVRGLHREGDRVSKLERQRSRLGHASRVLGTCLLLPLLACVGFDPANVALEQFDPEYGYRPRTAGGRDPGSVVVYLAFSGGGTRAAAFAYGVLEELRDTRIVVDGVEKSFLDEVDTLSGVSGGSFPAAYYALYGDRIFEEFEERFLKKNIQGILIWRVLRPWNLFRLMTPYLSRSDLASSYYHENVFDRATFADLAEARGPSVYINATDLSSGERVTFTQEGFDAICTDLNELPIATAVAASSAVPMMLSPITLENFAGSCNYQEAEWIKKALAERHENPRRNRAARNYENILDAEKKKFIHLVDGGVSDNLGLRASLDFASAVGSAKAALEVTQRDVPDHLVFIVVNAETDPNPTIDLSSASPSFASLMNSVSGGQIRRYNFETLMLASASLESWSRELSTPERPVAGHMVYVGFDEFEDKEKRGYFKLLPTSFVLTDREVDSLREAGRELLRASPAFQKLLEQLR